MENLINSLRESLKAHSDEKTVINGQKLFKEPIIAYGVKIPAVNKLSKDLYNAIAKDGKQKIFNLCEKLWQSGYFEEAVIACNLSYYLHAQYQPQDFNIFESWLKTYVNNWATCDTLCNHTIGTFVEMYPEYIVQLKIWTKSENRWVRRGSAVTLIIPARKALFLHDILDIADNLLLDGDDLVQKGYGWLLKACSEAHQNTVFNFVMERKNIMPRTALRYAIEKMPAELKAQAMLKPKNI